MVTIAFYRVAEILNLFYIITSIDIFKKQFIFMSVIFKFKFYILEAKNILSHFEDIQDAQDLCIKKVLVLKI